MEKVDKVDKVAQLKMAKLTVSLVEATLRQLSGNFAAVARAFDVSRQAVQQFISRHPSLVAVARECRESMKDDAESALYKAVHAGEAWAVCFYLKTQAKDRGYVEKQEQEHKHDGQVTLKVEYFDGFFPKPERISAPPNGTPTSHSS